MQPFVQRLRDLLQRLPLPTVLRWPVDVASLRKGVLQILERVHQAYPYEFRLREGWLEEGRLEFFLTHLDADLPGSFTVKSRKRRDELATSAVHVALRLPTDVRSEVDGLTPVERIELELLTTSAWEAAAIVRYAQRIGLLRLDESAEGKPWVINQPGRIFLDLAGSEAIHWLLVLEVVRHSGEPDLLDPALAQRLLASGTGKPALLNLGGLEHGNERIFDRLKDLYLLSGSVVDQSRPDDEGVMRDPGPLSFAWAAGHFDISDPYGNPYAFEFNLTPLGKEVLGAIAKDEDSPMKLLALALHRDQMTQVLTGNASKSAQEPARATDELIRQARMIAHELNNVLPPIRPAIEDLFQSLGDADRAAPQLLKYRSRIEAGVNRALSFVNQLRDTVQLARSTAQEAIDVVSCLQEALASLNGAAAAITLAPPARLPPLRGQRHDLVKALAELLRNALRATREHQEPQVHVEAQLLGSHIVIIVDDNGPGVPSNQREAIFVDGFTSRPGGGQGLALVREALRALGGAIACEDGPLGGARFQVKLPLTPLAPAGEVVP